MFPIETQLASDDESTLFPVVTMEMKMYKALDEDDPMKEPSDDDSPIDLFPLIDVHRVHTREYELLPAEEPWDPLAYLQNVSDVSDSSDSDD